MRKFILVGAALSTILVGSVASAQPYGYDQHRSERYRDSDRDGRPDSREWNRDRDRDGRSDQFDRNDRRRDNSHHHRYYGHTYGYDGYRGSWRTGQRFPYYNQRSYYIEDYRTYGLPPPRAGYRYYRDRNGDVVMAAVASGIIGLIIGGALNDNDHDRYNYDYRR